MADIGVIEYDRGVDRRRGSEWGRKWQSDEVLRSGVVLVALLMVMSCSGDDDDAAPIEPSEPVVTTSVPPTSEGSVVVDETVPETTDPPPTVTTVTTTTEVAIETLPPETVATTEPEPELTTDEQAVVDAAYEVATTWIDVLRDPRDEDLIAAAAVVRTGPALDRLVSVLADARSSGQQSAENPETPASVVVDETSVRFETQDRAIVEYCHVDTDFTIEVGSGPDGGDLVLSDTNVAKVEQDVLVLVDGRWLKESGTQLARFEGATTCGA